MEKRGAFDYILLETTGLADPGNIAPLFWVDDGLGSTIYLDGIVTVVDAKNILRSLDEPPPDTILDEDHGDHLTTAHLQISHADIIVLNKSDLTTPEELQAVRGRIHGINSLAKIHITSHSRVPELEGVLLDLHAYDSVTTDELDFASKGHSHLDPTISTTTIPIPPLDENGLSKLDSWLQKVLWEAQLPFSTKNQSSFEIHRVKGRICTKSGGVKLIQGVRDVFEMLDASDSSSRRSSMQEPFLGKLVLIGRGIDRAEFTDSLRHTLGINS